MRLRNATLTTIAPTGTLSLLANCSSGIEPLFAIQYTRRALEDMEFQIMDPLFIELGEKKGFVNSELIKALSEGASLQELSQVPKQLKELFIAAFEFLRSGTLKSKQLSKSIRIMPYPKRSTFLAPQPRMRLKKPS
jgi:ribonucleoside-diphosphate reductase alpha chain